MKTVYLIMLVLVVISCKSKAHHIASVCHDADRWKAVSPPPVESKTFQQSIRSLQLWHVKGQNGQIIIEDFSHHNQALKLKQLDPLLDIDLWGGPIVYDFDRHHFVIFHNHEKNDSLWCYGDKSGVQVSEGRFVGISNHRNVYYGLMQYGELSRIVKVTCAKTDLFKPVATLGKMKALALGPCTENECLALTSDGIFSVNLGSGVVKLIISDDNISLLSPTSIEFCQESFYVGARNTIVFWNRHGDKKWLVPQN